MHTSLYSLYSMSSRAWLLQAFCVKNWRVQPVQPDQWPVECVRGLGWSCANAAFHGQAIPGHMFFNMLSVFRCRIIGINYWVFLIARFHPLSIQTAQCQVGLAHKSSVLGRTVWKTCRAGCPKLPKGVALTTVMQRDVYNTVLRFQIIKLVTKPLRGSTHRNHSKHQPRCGLVTSEGLIVVLYWWLQYIWLPTDSTTSHCHPNHPIPLCAPCRLAASISNHTMAMPAICSDLCNIPRPDAKRF